MTRNMKAISAWLGVPPNEVLAPEGPVDPQFSVVVVRDGRGAPLCLLWNFAADIRLAEPAEQMSAGLPYFVQHELDARLGRHVPALYLPGCGGNISYQQALQPAVDAVTSAVMAAQLETSCDPLIRLGCAQEKMVVPVRDYSQYWSQPDVELKCPQGLDAFAQEVEYLKKEGAHALPTRVQALRMGSLALVGLPGMPFAEFALAVKEQSPAKATLVAGNSGGYLGPVVTRQAFDDGGFETWAARSARVGPGGGEFMPNQPPGCCKPSGSRVGHAPPVRWLVG
jgi:hypothetical protein